MSRFSVSSISLGTWLAVGGLAIGVVGICAPVSRSQIKRKPITQANLTKLSASKYASLTRRLLPDNAVSQFHIAPSMFATWFRHGKPEENGAVCPANSLTFEQLLDTNPDDGGWDDAGTNDSYRWAWQDFLWLTSIDPDGYGRVFQSRSFLDVSPGDLGPRHFIRHEKTPPVFTVRAAQAGAHGLSVMMSKSGEMYEVMPAKVSSAGRAMVADGVNQNVEIGRIARVNGQVSFFNVQGRPIKAARGLVPDGRYAEEIKQAGKSLYIDSKGHEVDTEEDQATGGALIAQNGSLVYYQTTVNDTYAITATGFENQAFDPPMNNFAATQADMDEISAYAKKHGRKISEPTACVIEMKTSWIEAAGIPDIQNYITTQATIPNYDKSNPKRWKPAGTKTTTLALVGAHVIGSTVLGAVNWATFEHLGTAPSVAYDYYGLVTEGKITGWDVTTHKQNTHGPWLFCQDGATSGFNTARQHEEGKDIVANGSGTIGPSNCIQYMPWGNPSDVDTDPYVSRPITNSRIIVANQDVLGQLSPKDPRSYYYLVGMTGGGFPRRGQVSNITMETFQVTSSLYKADSNDCLSCHQGNTYGTSHVFTTVGPLF